MKPKPPFVGTDCRVHLYTVPPVDLNVPAVVNPWNTKDDYTFRFYKPLHNLGLSIFRISLQNRFDRNQHFVHGLVKFFFLRILGF
jgi:hypothetical protein